MEGKNWGHTRHDNYYLGSSFKTQASEFSIQCDVDFIKPLVRLK
jgi:hypothetical protein